MVPGRERAARETRSPRPPRPGSALRAATPRPSRAVASRPWPTGSRRTRKPWTIRRTPARPGAEADSAIPGAGAGPSRLRSATTPRPPACASPSTTAARRSASSPRRWRAASACSTTTATAGSTSTPSRAGRFPPDPGRPATRRPPLPQPRRRHVRGRDRAVRASPACRGATATASPSATIDNDGHPDLFVTRWRSYALYRNRGDGTFEDVTGRAGLGGDRDWPTSAAFADLDDDGDLDLYVCHYLRLGRRAPAALPRPTGGRAIDPIDVRLLHAQPVPVAARPPLPQRRRPVRRRDGRGRHRRPRRPRPGRRRRRPRRRRPDRPVRRQRHDGQLPVPQPGRLPVRGGRRSRRASPATPRAATRPAWGSACGDLDGDGRPDLAVTNFYGESTTLYQQPGRAASSPTRPPRSAWPRPSRYLLGFGIAFARRQQRRPARPGHGQRPRRSTSGPTSPTRCPASSCSAAPTAAWSTSPRTPGPPGRSRASAAAWPPATSTTTAASTS